jgi:hypothetical protein
MLRNFRLRTLKGTPKGVKWPLVTSGSTTKKKARQKPGMRRTYSRLGPLPDRASSSHMTVTSGQKPLIGRYGTTSGCACAEYTSGHGHFRSHDWRHFRSCHCRSRHFRSHDFRLFHRIAPPQIIICPYPYTTSATFSNISAISWRPVLVVAEARIPGENHRSWASNW